MWGSGTLDKVRL